MTFTYPDVSSELNKSGKCLTTEISRKPYFSRETPHINKFLSLKKPYRRQIFSNHVDHLHNSEW